MRRRVVVTGIGMINPLGLDVATVWDQLPFDLTSVPWTESVTGFFLFSMTLSYYFMYNVRQMHTEE